MAAMLSPEQILGRERFSLRFRADVELQAAQNEHNANNQSTLWKTIPDYITNVNYRYAVSTNPIILFEWDMHDLWYMFVQASKVIDADDAGQDWLVAQVLYAREMGTISRIGPVIAKAEREEAITSEGFRIWTDLPYLVSDMREFWAKSKDMSPIHRYNFAAFTA